MISGQINARFEPVVHVSIVGSSEEPVRISAIID
jgi:hypothetical protein